MAAATPDSSGLDGSLGEQLEVVDEQNSLTGRLVERKRAHREGVLHRTVYALLSRTSADGEREVLLQQRHPDKAIYGGCWDLSAAEHVSPGESYAAAAARGLREELNIACSTLRETLPPTRRTLDCVSSKGEHVLDVEFVPLWEGEWEGGSVEPDGVEVAQVHWIAWPALLDWVRTSPADFTPWFRETLVLLGRL